MLKVLALLAFASPRLRPLWLAGDEGLSQPGFRKLAVAISGRPTLPRGRDRRLYPDADRRRAEGFIPSWSASCSPWGQRDRAGLIGLAAVIGTTAPLPRLQGAQGRRRLPRRAVALRRSHSFCLVTGF